MKRSEAEEQEMLFDWVKMQKGKYPELDLMWHTPNGEFRHKATAARLKKMGVKAGVPDIFLPVMMTTSVGGSHIAIAQNAITYGGLFIELKAKGGRLSEVQKDWLEALHFQGYAVCVCYGFEEAKQAILDYIKNVPRKWGVDYGTKRKTKRT